MNVLNAHLDDPRNQYPHTQHFLGLQVKLLVHALKFEAELHVALQNVLLLFMCADPAFQKYYAVRSTAPFAHLLLCCAALCQAHNFVCWGCRGGGGG
jgi:hypothetical protein